MAVSKNYGEYVVAVGAESRPSTSYNAQTTTRTGFLEFKPRDMETQKKYDAMSPNWEGVESSMKAVEQGVYSLDSAEKNRQDLRKQPVQVATKRELIPTLQTSCSIQ
jgi:hypothetical protein